MSSEPFDPTDSADESDGSHPQFPRKVNWSTFSVADVIERQVDPAWADWKERGNASLARGEFELATELYTRAYELALGVIDGGGFEALVRALGSWPEGSPQAQVAVLDDLLCHVLSQLPRQPERKLTVNMQRYAHASEEEVSGRLPNRPAAVTLSNRAASRLRFADACTDAARARAERMAALADAREAANRCPEYVKGHHRELQALRALGRWSEASEVQQALDAYARYSKLGHMSISHVLLSVGWLEWVDHTLTYDEARSVAQLAWLRRYARAVRAKLPAGLALEEALYVQLSVSLVDFHDGQMVTIGIRAGPRRVGGDPFGIKHEAVRDVQDVDLPATSSLMVHTGAGHLLARPPHGEATANALRHSAGCIARVLCDMDTMAVLPTVVTLGQGLHGHAAHLRSAVAALMAKMRKHEFVSPDDVHAALAASAGADEALGAGAGSAHVVPPFVNTLTTMASEDNFVPIDPSDREAWCAHGLPTPIPSPLGPGAPGLMQMMAALGIGAGGAGPNAP